MVIEITSPVGWSDDVRIGLSKGYLVGRVQRRAVAVRTTASEIPADVVVTAVCARPSTEVASTAGLGVEPGGALRTDAQLRTDDPAVFAAGDVAAAWHLLYDTRIRSEHWANALNSLSAGSSMSGRSHGLRKDHGDAKGSYRRRPGR